MKRRQTCCTDSPTSCTAPLMFPHPKDPHTPSFWSSAVAIALTSRLPILNFVPLALVMASTGSQSTSAVANSLPDEVITCLQNARFVSAFNVYQSQNRSRAPCPSLAIPFLTLAHPFSSFILCPAVHMPLTPCSPSHVPLIQLSATAESKPSHSPVFRSFH